MISVKRFFLSRKTALSLLFLIALAVLAAYVVPQRSATARPDMVAWLLNHPVAAPWVEWLGLDHVYSTPWFAAILFTFLVSIILSTQEQTRRAWKKTFALPHPNGPPVEAALPHDEVAKAIRLQGYLRVVGDETRTRYVKHPWGYWGNALFHLGIVLVITASLLVVLTQRSGQIHLTEGELFPAETPLRSQEKGLLAGGLTLPDAVRLDSVSLEFWETDDQKQLSSVISFIDRNGNIDQQAVAINKIVPYRGMRLYQGRTFGSTLLVTLSGRDGRDVGLRLDMPYPSRRDKASYGEFNYDVIPYRIKAKYFADADMTTMDSADPLLVMRLMEKDTVVDEVSLRLGKSAAFGPYRATLVDARKWTGFILVDMTGLSLVFIGFLIIILGAGLTYFVPPREFIVAKSNGLLRVVWKAARFEHVYQDEYAAVTRHIKKEGTDE